MSFSSPSNQNATIVGSTDIQISPCQMDGANTDRSLLRATITWKAEDLLKTIGNHVGRDLHSEPAIVHCCSGKSIWSLVLVPDREKARYRNLKFLLKCLEKTNSVQLAGMHFDLFADTLLIKTSYSDEIASENAHQYETDIFQGPYSHWSKKFNMHLCVAIELIHESKPIGPLHRRMEKLLNDQVFGDFTLVCEGKEVLAYKGLLASQSPVLAAMFDHKNTAEMLTNRVSIDDMSFETLKEFVLFTYTGIFPDEKLAVSLFGPADKYRIEELKQWCECRLANQITLENVCDYLILADQHSADFLKKQTTNFIVKNAIAVTATDGWTRMNANIELFKELFHYLAVTAKNRVSDDGDQPSDEDE